MYEKLKVKISKNLNKKAGYPISGLNQQYLPLKRQILTRIAAYKHRLPPIIWRL